MSTTIRTFVLFAGLIAFALLARDSSAATIGLNFTGTDRSFSQIFVPDTMGAVGPNHIVEFLNGSFAVYNKTTGQRLLRNTDQGFWQFVVNRGGGGSVVNGVFDPRVVYDPASRRWFALQVADNGSPPTQLLLAVSDTDTPFGAFGSLPWKGFILDGDPSANPDTRWSDFPTLGVDRDSITIETTLIDFVNQGVLEPRGIAVYSIPKSDLLQSTPTVANRSQFTFAKLAALGNSNSALHGVLDVGPADGRASLFAANPKIGLQRWDLLNTAESRAGAATLSSPTSIPVNPFEIPPTADQPGNVQNLYNLGGPFTGLDGTIVDDGVRFGSSLVQQGSHAWGVHVAKAGERSGVRWYEIDLETNQIVQSGTISDPALDLIHPSIAVNQFGDAVIGFTATGETLFPSAYAVVGDTIDGVTTFGNLLELKRGVSTYVSNDGLGRNRWGDYSATVVDPSDPLHFWTFQEFTSAQDVWAVQITEIIVPEPSTLALFALAAGLLVAGHAARRCRRMA